MGLRTITLCVLLANAVAAFAAPQQPIDVALPLNIAAQPIEDALNELARQTGLQVAVYSEIGQGHTTPAVSGTLTPRSALQQLLAGTELTYDLMDGNTIAIHPLKTKSTSILAPAEQNIFLVQSADAQRQTQDENTGARSDHPSSGIETRTIDEVIVTAQKRSERLQDVPVPVAVVDASTLVNSSQMRLQDYYTKIPGLNLTMMGDVGSALISIRGMTTGGYINPTVGVVIDDIPFGASAGAALIGSNALAPDLDPSELSRVEVLRGPQGTLYGASSLGGLLKFMTIDPSTDRVSGRLQLGTSSISKSDELGYAMRGAINLPITETFAMRASGSVRRDPGYIDNVQTGEEDTNRTDSQSGRLAGLWRPSDNFLLKLSALYQHFERDGTSDTHLPPPIGRVAGLGDLQQSALINTGMLEQKFQAYSAIATGKLGHSELTSLSGYSISELDSALDASPALGGFSQTRFGVGGFVQNRPEKTSKFTQELRLSTPLGSRVEWLAGAFYTHESSSSVANLFAVNPASGAIAGHWYQSSIEVRYAEYAAFTDLTFQLTDRFDVQVGGRISKNKINVGAINSAGPYNIVLLNRTDPFVTPAFESRDTPLTYLLTPRFKVSPDLMVYARLASGYRPGGPNTTTTAALATQLPREYGADTTQTYELGAKGNALNRLLSFDASVYYIDWKDVQLQLRDPVNSLLSYTLNAGGAKSQGIELSLDLKPLRGLTISVWGAYNDAELTEVPTTSVLTARVGDRLPYGARRSGNLSVDQTFPLAGDLTGFVGTSLSYMGERKGRFFTGVPQGIFPAYSQLDLRAGAKWDSWTINAFVNNVADKRGVLRGGRDASLSFQYAITYTQPRTGGLSISKDF